MVRRSRVLTGTAISYDFKKRTPGFTVGAVGSGMLGGGFALRNAMQANPAKDLFTRILEVLLFDATIVTGVGLLASGIAHLFLAKRLDKLEQLLNSLLLKAVATAFVALSFVYILILVWS